MTSPLVRSETGSITEAFKQDESPAQVGGGIFEMPAEEQGWDWWRMIRKS